MIEKRGQSLISTDTKDLILDTAERLFAARGFDATSLRTITSEAGVNLAAVHYHFGSKDALIETVLHRRLVGLNEERLDRLSACERASGDVPPALECVVRAFVEPPLQLSRDPARGGNRFMRLMGGAYSHPGDYLFRVFRNRFGDFIERFTTAIARALPGLSPVELHSSFHFMVGAMAHTMAASEELERVSRGAVDMSDTNAIVDRLVTFTVSGMRAVADKASTL
jgi:AcrR family transcriptional regulator